MMQQQVNFRRVARILGLFIFAIFVALMSLNVATSWAYTSWLINVPCSGSYSTLPNYPSEEIRFNSRDGFEVRGFFIEGHTHSDIAIIVQPGYGGNTQAALPDAQVLADAGYSLMLFEHRSCTGANVNSGLGVFETQDVLGAVDYLSEREEVERIGGFGFSAGGTAMMLAASQDERIEAVIIQGALDDLRGSVLGESPPKNLFERIYRGTTFWLLQARLGASANQMRPYQSVGAISPRPIFFVYGEFEPQRASNTLYAAAGEPKSLWIVEGAGHGGYIYAAPDTYPQRMVDFFDEAFETRP